jgi:mannosyl-glycoprotein endo-beta-N-acetylglucosaminidase
VLIGIFSFAIQPYSSYWFINELLEWSPENDPDADFNRGVIPLKKRLTGEIVNPNARDEARIAALSIMHPSTSDNPSEGYEKFDVYTFHFWQYIDKLVMWGGSAGEGIILSPSADVINAGHKNGVKVLGTVFFPPVYYGGQLQWYRDFIEQREDGSFPVADKLIEVADYYGFDGWFINQELEGTTAEEARKMQEFLSYFNANKKRNMEIMWYDAMTIDGELKWQNHLTEKNVPFLINDDKLNDSAWKLALTTDKDGFLRRRNQLADTMFLNFWWKDQTSSKELAEKLGLNPYDIYAGIDTQANGYNTQVHWDGLFPENQEHILSLAIYCPNWTHSSSQNHDEYMMKENLYWVGGNLNPSNTVAPYNWKGMANYVPAQTPITKAPFVTNFNTGNGLKYAINGEIVSEKEWNNRSIQDILPTWRWFIEGNPINVGFDWENPYYGGSSLKFSGNVNGKTNVYIYKTKLKIEAGDTLSITYKTNDKNVSKLGLMLENGNSVYFDLSGKENEWETFQTSLNNHIGKTISRIYFVLDSENETEDFNLNVGRISYIDRRTQNNSKISSPSNLEVTAVEFVDGIVANVRLKWSNNQTGLLYEVYRVVDGEREYLGSTYNNVYYVGGLNRLSVQENETELIVVPVNNMYNNGKEISTTFKWVDYPNPTAAFYVDRTYIAPGDTIEFKNRSKVYDSVKWFFSGGDPLISFEENPSVTYNGEGEFRVTLIAYNEVGRDTLVEVDYITVTEKARVEMELVSLNKSATASGFVPGEAPEMALDGNQETKWCATGDLPHTLIVDLEKEQRLGKFVVKHAEEGGESKDMNTREFIISLSDDGEEWREVVNVKENTSDVSEHLIPIQRARYVKLEIIKATQGNDTAARIYGFDIYAEKDLFDNYAFGKEAVASSFVPGETPAFALNEETRNNSKWCAVGAEPHWLMVDLGQEEIIDKFLLKHAEEGGESKEWNTRDFYIEVSSDNETWVKALDVKENTEGLTEHFIKPVRARYVRLTITNATQTGDSAVRLYEFRVLGYKTHKTNKGAGKTATASGFVPGETPSMAFDQDTSTKWCAVGGEPHTLIVDLENTVTIERFVIKHAEEGGEGSSFNTREFNIYISEDNENWVKVVEVTDNEKGLSEHIIKPVEAKYVKFEVIKATQGGDTAARIYEIEVHGN